MSAVPISRITIGSPEDPNDLKSRLRKRLVDEWKENGTVQPLPRIREEIDATGRVVHVYVIWEEWGEKLDHNERSEIITEAFWEVFGEKGLALTIAMGLTPVEAERMGLN